MADIRLTFGKLNNRQDSISLGKITDFRDPSVPTIVTGENIDVDNAGLATMRRGRKRRYSGAVHSFWSKLTDDSTAYFIEATELKRLEPDYSTTSVTFLTVNAKAVFEEVNDQVVVTNGTDIGWVDGAVYTAFNPTLGRHEKAFPPCQYLALLNGVLYGLADDVLYASKPHNIEVYDERYGIYPLAGYGRMLAAVEDGLWVSNGKHVAFIQGGGAEDFVYEERTDNVPPDGAFAAGFEDTDTGVRRFVAWPSKEGVIVGHAGGNYANLSYPEVSLPEGATGRCFVRTINGIDQIVSIIHNPGTTDAFTPTNRIIKTINV